MALAASNRLNSIDEYFFSKKRKHIQEIEARGHRVINLGIGSPDLPPHDSVIDSLKNSASEADHHGYQPYNGIEMLRKEIAGWLSKTYETILRPDEILPLMGSKEGILHIQMAFSDPGDIILVPEIGYPAYRSIANICGNRVIEYPLNDQWQPDFDHFTSEMRSAKIMWLNYPHMPTGAKADLKTFEKAVAYGKNHQILICHDNPYSLILNDKPISIFKAKGSKEVALELNSLSKSHNMAGWRLGWVAGCGGYIEKILQVKSNIDSGMFRGIQDAAITALRVDESWHLRRNSIYRERQEKAFELLSALNCQYDNKQSGLFAWGKLPKDSNSETFCDELLENHHIFATPGFIFGEKGRNYIRLSLCSKSEEIQLAIDRVKKR